MGGHSFICTSAKPRPLGRGMKPLPALAAPMRGKQPRCLNHADTPSVSSGRFIISGGFGHLTEGIWDEPEADKFAKIAIEMGVSKEKIIIENKSTNTSENILFTKALLAEKSLTPKTFLVVQKPYMERRAYATFKKFWPEKEVIVTSPPISYEEYPDELRSKEDVIGIMVGDLQRIKLYAEKGWQIPQEIPDDVWQAYEELITLGYTQHLVL